MKEFINELFALWDPHTEVNRCNIHDLGDLDTRVASFARILFGPRRLLHLRQGRQNMNKRGSHVSTEMPSKQGEAREELKNAAEGQSVWSALWADCFSSSKRWPSNDTMSHALAGWIHSNKPSDCRWVDSDIWNHAHRESEWSFRAEPAETLIHSWILVKLPMQRQTKLLIGQ